MSAKQWFEDAGTRSAHVARIGKNEKWTYTAKFKAIGFLTDAEVHGYANAFFSTYRFKSILGNLLLVDSYDVSHLGGDCWEVTANYESQGAERDSDPLKRSRSFETTGATAHRTIAEDGALGERRYGKPNELVPNQWGAIDADGDSVKGVDVVTPSLQWAESYDVPAGYVTANYIKTVAMMTGTTNNAPFRSFLRGEVLFLGATGSQQWDDEKGEGPWALQFKFQASPNAGPGQTLPALTVGEITNVQKYGHEFLWIRYGDSSSADTQTKVPKFVYVNRVYRESNFGALGIGR